MLILAYLSDWVPHAVENTSARFSWNDKTVSRYLRRLSPAVNAGKLWATFLRNHREVIAAMDLFTVPTLSFQILYCFFVIDHGRPKILHSNVNLRDRLLNLETPRAFDFIKRGKILRLSRLSPIPCLPLYIVLAKS
jgi:hypothetical protein